MTESGLRTDSRKRTYVLDTSVLLSDPRAMTRFAEHDVVLPLSFKGRMQDLIWGRFVRPMMKGLFYALPSGLRRRIKISDAHAASSDAHAGGD